MRRTACLCLLLAAVSAIPLSSAQGQAPARELQLVAVSQGDNTLALLKFEGKGFTVLKTFPIGKGTRELCVSPDGSHAYTSNAADNSMTAVDLNAQKVTGTITSPDMKKPDGCAVSPDLKKLYVAAIDSEVVVVVSVETNQVLKTIKVGKEPRRVLFTPDKRRFYVSAEAGDTINVLDAVTEKIVDNLKSGGHAPRTMLFLPDRKTLLVTNVDDDTVSFIKTDTKEVDLTIGAGGSPQRLAVSRDGLSAFVLAVLEEKISIIDLKGPHIRAKKFMPVGHGPYGMAMTDDGSFLFVSASKDNELTAYDTTTMSAVAKTTIKTPYGVALR